MQKAGEPCGLSCGDAVSGNGDFDVRGAIGGDIYAVAEAVAGVWEFDSKIICK